MLVEVGQEIGIAAGAVVGAAVSSPRVGAQGAAGAGRDELWKEVELTGAGAAARVVLSAFAGRCLRPRGTSGTRAGQTGAKGPCEAPEARGRQQTVTGYLKCRTKRHRTVLQLRSQDHA